MKNQTTPSGLLSFWVLLIGLAIIILGISFAHAAAPEDRNLTIEQDVAGFNTRWRGQGIAFLTDFHFSIMNL